MLQFLYHDLQFYLPIFRSQLLILLKSKAVIQWYSANKVFVLISQNSEREYVLVLNKVADIQRLIYQKRDSLAQMFSEFFI